MPTAPSPAQPCTLVIFGASGDLTRRKLLPAVYNLLLDGLLARRLCGPRPWAKTDER